MPKNDLSTGIIHEWIQQNKFSEALSFLQDDEPKDKSAYVDNLSSNYKQTPLAEACRVGHVELVEALLKCGADVSKGGLRTRKTVLDYAHEKPDIISKVLDPVKLWVDNWKEIDTSSSADKAKYVLLAYSLADYYQAQKNIALSQFYFKKAQDMSDPKKYSSNQSTMAAISGPISWRLFKYQLFNGDMAQASKNLELSLKAYAVTSSQDIATILFEQDTIYDSFIELIKLNNTRCLPFLDTINDRLVKSSMTAEQKTALVKRVLDFISNYSKDNKFINPAVIQKVSLLIITAIKHVDIDDTEKLNIAKNLQSIGRNLDKMNSVLSRELFTASNGFLERIKEKNSALSIIKNINDDFLKYFTNMDNVESEFSRAERPKNYTEFLNLMTRILQIDTNPSFAKNLVRYKYKLRVIGQIGGLIDLYYQNATNVNPNLNDIIVSQLRLTKLTDQLLQKIQTDTDKFWIVIQLLNNHDDLTRFYNAMYNIITALKSTKIPSLDPKKITQATYYFLEKLNSTEIEMFLRSSESDRNSFKFHSITFYLKDIEFISMKMLTRSNTADRNLQAMAEKIDCSLSNTLALIESHPPVQAPLFFYLTLFMAKAVLQKDIEKAARSLGEAISKTLKSEEINSPHTKNIEDAALGLVFLGRTDVSIFGNFSESDRKAFQQLLAATKTMYSKIQKLNTPYEKKDDLYKGIMDFWLKAIGDASKKGHSDLAMEAALFITSSKIASSDERKIAKIGAIISENFKAYLEKILKSDEILRKNMPTITSYIKLLLESGERKLVGSIINSLVSELTRSQFGLVPEIGEKLISIAKELPPKSIHPQTLTDLNFIVLRNLMAQTSHNFNKILIFTDESAAYYTAPLSEVSHKPHDYLNVMRTSYNRIADNNKENKKFAAALDCYNTLMELDLDNIKEYIEKANEILKKLLDNTEKTSFKILLLEELIDNYTYLEDSNALKLLHQELFSAKLKLIEHYVSNNNLKGASKIYDEVLNHAQISDQPIYFKEKIEKIKLTIDRQQQFLNQLNQTQLFFTSSSTSKKKKPRKKADEEEIKEEKVTKDLKKEDESIQVKEAPTFPNGKVGMQIKGNFIAKDNSSFFPVVKKDISDFNKLKKTNFVLYKKLKKAALDGEICREFGQSGIKYLGSDTWEAKVSGKSRLFGKTVEKDGKKFIVFDTYSPKGLHRSK